MDGEILGAYNAFFGGLGATFAMSMTGLGSAIGIAWSGASIAASGVFKPDVVIKSIIPVVMASIVSIYGLILAVIISRNYNFNGTSDDIRRAYLSLGAGMATGFAGLSGGYSIGVSGYSGVITNMQQPKFFVGMVLILIFGEVLAVYGLIVGLLFTI